MNNRTIRTVIIFGALAIMGVIAVQSFWLIRALDVESREFHQSVSIALRKVAEDLAQASGSTLPNTSLVVQRSSDYYVVNINDVINANHLEFYLLKELEAAAVLEEFEYGIFDCANDKMVYGNYLTLSGVTPVTRDPSLTSLPTYDEFIYYFGVRFPGRSTYLMNEIRLPLLFSVLLGVAILFFAYSIFIILRQKRLSEMQRDFINNMTHEFKTPISTIKISSEVFLKDATIKKNPRLHKYASVIKEQNERLNDQVEKVLQLARIEKDSFQLNIESCNLHEIIEQVVSNARVNLAQTGGSISTQLEAEHYEVNADKTHLTNILYSLIDNSLKYCKKAPEIVVSTLSRYDGVQIVIEDNGMGIPEEYKTKVFQKFFRIPTGNIHDVKGFGLGLFYVDTICNLHKWKLELESEEGLGTKVKVGIKMS